MTPSFAPVPRLYHVNPLVMGRLDDWPRHFDRIAAMGFDWVLSAPPFATGPTGNLFLALDATRLHPALGWEGTAEAGLARLAEEANRRGLGLALDLAPARVAAGGALSPAPAADGDDEALDPRIAPGERGAATLCAERILEAWSGPLARIAQAGVAGWRFIGLDRAPPEVWRALIEGLRAARPGSRVMAWTPGLGFDHRRALEGVGFDAVFSSLRWWDGRSGWLIDEHDLHRSIGPAIAFPEAPFGPRLARETQGPAEARRVLGRALWLAAGLGDGLLVPMGFEFGARDAFEATRGRPADMAEVTRQAPFDLSDEIAAANLFVAGRGSAFTAAGLHALAGPGAPIAALIRTDHPDPRRAGAARIVLVNPDLRSSGTVEGRHILPEAGGRITRFVDIAGTLTLSAGTRFEVEPAGVRILEGRVAEPILGLGEAVEVETAVRAPRLAIERIEPCIDHGAFPVRRRVGETVIVEADLIGDGHDRLAGSLLWRAADEEDFQEVRLAPLGNDRWVGRFPLERVGRHCFTVEVWRDVFETYRSEITKKHAAGLDIALELEEGRQLVAETLHLWHSQRGDGVVGARLADLLARLGPSPAELPDPVGASTRRSLESGAMPRRADPTVGSQGAPEHADPGERLSILLSDDTADLMRIADPKRFGARREPPMPVDAERAGASFAAWYEVFPRSLSDDPDRHGTFDDVIRHLPRIRDMGFDVLYFPPIHPIGRTNRKGRNNSLKAGPGDPGSPYAIGSPDGGHDAIHPELGTLDDFRRLVAAAAEHGLEIALDFAIQCSPDHPWLTDHPEWFDWRPDGSIRYAENPPKRYEDIVNVDFYAEGATPALWLALRDVTLFWVEQGIRLFRVDNPHTKPFPFWQWLIADIRARHPDVVFLAEAFTRPKVMNRLAKIGFSQSYTYFTWRNTRHDLESYLTELTARPAADYFRPHFFVNTPDINPVFLHNAPRSAFLIRACLAATLSGLWGVYNGFELCEGRPVPGREEYLDSEKYEIRAWDWDRPGNIRGEITRLNRIRRDNPALHSHLGTTLLRVANERILWVLRRSPDRTNALLVAVCLDPLGLQESDAELPLWEFGLPDGAGLDLEDLVTGGRFRLVGKHQTLRLDPSVLPYAIWRVAVPPGS